MTSKLSLYILRYDTDNPAAPIAGGGVGDTVGLFDMVKIHCSGDNPVMVNWLLAHDPHIIVYVRNPALLEEPYDNWARTPENASKMWGLQKPYRKAFIDKSRVVLCLPPNEPGVDVDPSNTSTDAETVRRTLSQWWAQLAAEASADGWHIGMGNFSAEARLADKWQSFIPMLEACEAGGHYLDLHAYAPSPNILDSTYEEFLYPWKELRAHLWAAGRNDLAQMKIISGEFGEDHNIVHQAGSSGYRETMNNATYAAQLAKTAPVLAADKVSAFIFMVAAANYNDANNSMAYNINIGMPQTKHSDADPSVFDRLRPIMAAQTGGGPIEIPPPEPPVTPPVLPPVPSSPRRGVVIRTADGLPNLRSIPSKNGVMLYKGYPAGRHVTLTGKEQAGYVEVLAPRVLDESDPPVSDTAWLVKSFVQIVS